MQLKTLVASAISLQIIDGVTTYYSIKNYIGYEANPFLSSLSPEIIFFVKVLYALFLYALYVLYGNDTELKNTFHICLYLNIFLYSIVFINNMLVIL